MLPDDVHELERQICEYQCSKFADFFEIKIDDWFSGKYLSRLDKKYWELRGMLESHPTDPDLFRLNLKQE